MTAQLELWLTGAAVLALLVASAFFSGSETALTAASRARMHSLEQDGDKRARTVNRLIGDREKLIGALLLGNTIVNTLNASLATGFLVGLFGDRGVALATVAMTVLIVIFAEVLPKTYAITYPDRTALGVARSIRLAVALLSPVNNAVVWIVRQVLRLIGTPVALGEAEEAAHEEIRGAIDLHHKEGAVVKGDRDMLGGILDLGDLVVSDIMVHRTEMETLSAEEPMDKLIEDALASAYSRIPVWSEDPDNIIGILHVKDMMRELSRQGWDRGRLDVRAFLTPAWFVPDTTSLKDQLEAFQRRNAHIALVVDEYGEVMGLVTLEDIIEEIVGQIEDEHDTPDPGIRPQADGRVVVDGSVPVRDLNRHMDWSLPDEEATTIAGLVIHEAQTIPEPGQAFTFYGYRFEIVKKSKNRLTTLRITPLERKDEGADKA